MLHKKESEALVSNEILIAGCPICGAVVMHQYYMQESSTKKRSKWYSCKCGVIWNAEVPSKKYDKKYYDDCTGDNKKVTECWRYPVELFMPIIEEATYGRKALIVGLNQPHQKAEMVNRGWVTFSIDKNTDMATSDRHINADFETFEFPEDTKYSLIWCYHTLECFTDPKAAIAKMVSLLGEDGIIFLGTPDTDFVHTRSSAGFQHWKPDLNHIMWNKRSLTGLLEHQGLEIITCRRNCEKRMAYTDDLQIIAQRRFY